MSRQLNPAQIWSQVPLANRTASVIKSMQTGTASLSSVGSTTVTITSVTTAKSHVVYLGSSTTSTVTAAVDGQVVVALTNSTTLTFTRQTTNNAAYCGYAVVEYY
jgi:hypothetical protein